jgi:hypothetical protein
MHEVTFPHGHLVCHSIDQPMPGKLRQFGCRESDAQVTNGEIQNITGEKLRSQANLSFITPDRCNLALIVVTAQA